MKPSKLVLVLVSIVLLFIFSNRIFAQTDTEFWLAVPATTTNHGDMGGRIKHIVVSTLGNPATVTVSIPANAGFTPIVVDTTNRE